MLQHQISGGSKDSSAFEPSDYTAAKKQCYRACFHEPILAAGAATERAAQQYAQSIASEREYLLQSANACYRAPIFAAERQYWLQALLARASAALLQCNAIEHAPELMQ